MLGFGKKRTSEPTPPWLKWLVIVFILMGLAGSLKKGSPDAPNKMQEAFHQMSTSLEPAKFSNFETYKNKVLPSNSGLRMEEQKQGEGQPAVCGQEVSLAYSTWLDEHTSINDSASEDKPLTFRIGSGTVPKALELGVVGMKAGGERILNAPAELAYGAEKFARSDVPPKASVRFQVRLLSMHPTLPDPAASPYRILPVRSAYGPDITCGAAAKVKVTLWALDGKKLYPTQVEQGPITFTPGQSEVFLGLEQGVIGMTPGSTRTLIVPPAWQKTMNGNAPALDFPFPKDQTVLVDIEGVP